MLYPPSKFVLPMKSHNLCLQCIRRDREARVDFSLASWDITQVYPSVNENEAPVLAPELPDTTYGSGSPDDTGNSGPTFYYDVGAEGQITLTMFVSPFFLL